MTRIDELENFAPYNQRIDFMKQFAHRALCTGLLLSATAASAQPPHSDPQGPLTERLSELEERVNWLPRISGYIQARYRWDEADGENTFSVRRVRLSLKGAPAGWIDYRLQVELASSPKLMDAVVRLKIRPWANFQIGQQKVPLSLENPYPSLQFEAIDNAQVITNLTGFKDLSGINAAGRDIGVAFYGAAAERNGFSAVEYTFGVFNGSGINRSDDNSSKDFAARLDLHPVRALTLSASCYIGGATLSDPTHEKSRTADRHRYGAGIRFDDEHLLLRGEYLYGKTGSLESDGWYLLAGLWIRDKVQPVVRYDAFRRDRAHGSSLQTNYMAGANWWPAKFLRLQLNYTLKTFAARGRGSRSLVAAELAVAF